MVLVIVSVHDNCCSRLLIDWTLWEADSKWKIEKFFYKVFVGLFESDLLYIFNTVFNFIMNNDNKPPALTEFSSRFS